MDVNTVEEVYKGALRSNHIFFLHKVSHNQIQYRKTCLAIKFGMPNNFLKNYQNFQKFFDIIVFGVSTSYQSFNCETFATIMRHVCK